jgi:hypothetical protein
MPKLIVNTAVIIASIFSINTYASIRSIYLDRDNLLLTEKTGRAENSLDNPANLTLIPYWIVESGVDQAMDNSQSNATTISETSTNESRGYSVQCLAPVYTNVCLNTGWKYSQTRQLACNTYPTSGEVISQTTQQQLYQQGNVGLAWSPFEDIRIGYSLSTLINSGTADLFPGTETSTDSYSNHSTKTRHALGVAWENLDLDFAYAFEEWKDGFNSQPEIDFLFEHLTLNARYILGERDHENLSLQITFTQSALQQNQFDMARSRYNLDLPKDHCGFGIYYLHPETNWESALGIEGAYDDRNIYNFDQAQFIGYRTYQAVIPCMFSGKILSFLSIWGEYDLTYTLDSWQGYQSWILHQHYGFRLQGYSLEFNLYTEPSVQLLTATKTTSTQTTVLGVDLLWRY